MKRTLGVFICFSATFAVSLQARAQDQQTPDESQLDAILKSDRSPGEKDAACSQLKRVATAQSVPILADLLTDPQLSHSARYALESMSAPEAGQALLDALDKTSGSNQVGMVSSLAARRQVDAVSKIAGLLSNADTITAAAAANALGRIGGDDVRVALTAALPASTGVLHEAEVDGLLTCAYSDLRRGNQGVAANVFSALQESETNKTVRIAAFRGLVLSSGDNVIKLALDAIVGGDPSRQSVALQLSSRLPGGTATTEALAASVAKVQAPVQIALVQSLQQRGDPAAGPAVASLLDSPDANVRLAAIAALGDLGDSSVILPLADMAASAPGPERNSARQALVDLRRGSMAEALVNALEGTPAGTQLELMRALGDRGDSYAAAKLLKIAQSEDDSIRAGALHALALVAVEAQTPNLVELVVNSKDDDARSEAAEALGDSCQRIEARAGHCDVQSLADAARSAAPETRIVLLPICAELIEAPTREALRASLTDPKLEVREAAMRTLCDTRDGELLSDLLKLTEIQRNKKIRMLAIRGCVRLATQEDTVKLSAEEKLRIIAQIYKLPLDTEEKRIALAGLGAVPDKRALVMLMPIMDDAAVQPEAAAAVLRIAKAVSNERDQEAVNALKKVLTLFSATPDARKAAQDGLKAIQ